MEAQLHLRLEQDVADLYNIEGLLRRSSRAKLIRQALSEWIEEEASEEAKRIVREREPSATANMN